MVQFLDLSTRPGHCGYCGGEGAVSQGMFVERLLLEDYQQLLDRGWRRSGRYTSPGHGFSSRDKTKLELLNMGARDPLPREVVNPRS